MRTAIATFTATVTVVVFPTPVEAEGIQNCDYTGVVNVYAEKGEDAEIVFGGVQNKFHEFDCDKGKMRIYKTKGNTKAEFKELKQFAREHAYKNYPEAVCGNAKKSKLLSLSHFFYRKYFHINKAEQEHYKSWIRKYADRNDCKLFATSEIYKEPKKND